MYKKSTAVFENQTHFIPCKAYMLGSKRLGKKGIHLLPLKKKQPKQQHKQPKTPKNAMNHLFYHKNQTYSEVSNRSSLLW